MADRRFPRRNEDNENTRMSISDDYIELSSSKRKDEYEDVYSYSTPQKNDDYVDVYSDSSYEDVYIGRNRGGQQQNNQGFYVNNRPIQPQVQEPQKTRMILKRPTEEIPVVKQPAPPVRKTNAVRDTDEISDHEARYGKHKKKKSHAKGLVVVALLLAIIVGFGGLLFVAANGIVSEFSKAEDIEHIEDVDSLVSDRSVRNILLIGTDKESGGAARSDSIMIASINKSTGKITVCSVLRDTHLYIPGKQEAKVNAAYAWGGANLLVQTIEHNFGIKIDDYATVDFEMFTDLVDGLGGVTVDVSENEADYINNRHGYGDEERPDPVESGENVRLNGYQALWYARIRKLDSDFMRTERQRKVISAIAAEAKEKLNPVGVFELVSTAKNVAPYIETTLSTFEFWGLITSLSSCLVKSGGNMDELYVSQKIPFDGTWWYSSEWDGSSISIDLEENKELLYKLLYEESEDIPEETTEE